MSLTVTTAALTDMVAPILTVRPNFTMANTTDHMTKTVAAMHPASSLHNKIGMSSNQEDLTGPHRCLPGKTTILNNSLGNKYSETNRTVNKNSKRISGEVKTYRTPARCPSTIASQKIQPRRTWMKLMPLPPQNLLIAVNIAYFRKFHTLLSCKLKYLFFKATSLYILVYF